MERKVCTYCGKEGHNAANCPWRPSRLVLATVAALAKQPHADAIRKNKTAKARTPRERDIERYLVKRAKAQGGEVRKVQWVGRRGAPDRLVMLPAGGTGLAMTSARSALARPPQTIWVELKSPGVAPETHQLREHARMRALGQRVAVIDSFEAVDRLLG